VSVDFDFRLHPTLEEQMVQKTDLEIFEEEARRLNRDFADPEDDGTYRISVVLLSAALGGSSDVDDLAEFTG